MIWSLVVSLLRHPAVRWSSAVLVALALGYGLGRYAQPAKVEEHTVTKTNTEYKDRIVYQDRVVFKQARVRVVYRDIVRTVTVVKAKDGTETTTTTIADHSKDTTNTTADRTTTSTDTRTDTGATQSNSSSSKLVASQPNWMVGAFGTLELVGPVPHSLTTLDPRALNGTLLYGVHAERRLWGPLWLGLSGGGTRSLKGDASGFFVGTTLAINFSF